MIDKYEFGFFVIDGRKYSCNIKLMGNKFAGSWEHGLHIVKIEHIKDLVADMPEVIVIGTGASGALKVPQEVQEHIKSKGIKLIIEKCRDAVLTYNRLIEQGKKANALMHNTC